MISTMVREILSTPALLVGLFTLIGLLIQKKSIDHVIKGTVTAIVGFVLLDAGSQLLQNGALADFGRLFEYDFNLQGVVPNMEAVSSLGISEHATMISVIMLLGMIFNIILARLSAYRYIFLTGHHILYMACLLCIVLSQSDMPDWQIIAGSGILLGFLMCVLPALAQSRMRELTGSDKVAIGHFSVFGYILASAVGAVFAPKRGEDKTVEKNMNRSTEDVKFPAKLGFMRDTTVGIFIVMTAIFLVLSGIAAARTDLSELDISYQSEVYQSWMVYAVVQGAKFSAAIYIILAGVRLTIAEIVPAFKGIAAKAVPDAKPAVDCPVLFSYAPNAAMIGFLSSFAGGVAAMAVMIAVSSCTVLAVPVIVPGVVAHFFCGGTAGVFANAKGGLKGCVAGAFVHGIFISALSLFVMPVLGTFNMAGTSFSDADFCVVGIILGNLIRHIPSQLMFALCILIAVIPVAVYQVKMHSRK